MINIIKYLWQLPQNILGLIVISILKAEKRSYKVRDITYTIYTANWRGGVSLGNYMIVDLSIHGDKTILHERGHQIQSLILGPLYLILVGIPSITFNILTMLTILDINKYYKRYPEFWADKIMGIER